MIKKYIKAYTECIVGSGLEHKETKDCAVRAFSLAANKPYKEVHALAAKHGRKPGKGTNDYTIGRISNEYNGEQVQFNYYQKSKAPTLAQFLRDNPKGSFYVSRSHHAFAVIDGVVHDWANTTGARTRVLRAIKFTKENS